MSSWGSKEAHPVGPWTSEWSTKDAGGQQCLGWILWKLVSSSESSGLLCFSCLSPHTPLVDVGHSWGELSQINSSLRPQGQAGMRRHWNQGFCVKFFILEGETGSPPGAPCPRSHHFSCLTPWCRPAPHAARGRILLCRNRPQEKDRQWLTPY